MQSGFIKCSVAFNSADAGILSCRTFSLSSSSDTLTGCALSLIALAPVVFRVYSPDDPSHGIMKPDVQVTSSPAASPCPAHTAEELFAGEEAVHFTPETAELPSGFFGFARGLRSCIARGERVRM